jgi:hypothetical protein
MGIIETLTQSLVTRRTEANKRLDEVIVLLDKVKETEKGKKPEKEKEKNKKSEGSNKSKSLKKEKARKKGRK